MAKQQRAYKTDLDVRKAIEEMALEFRLRGERPNGAEIARKLMLRFPDSLPSEKTVKKIADAVADPGAPWRSIRSTVDATLVLPTLARLVDNALFNDPRFGGGRTQLAVREAELIAAVAKMAPDLPDPLDAYHAAREYIAAEEDEDDDAIVGLDLWLAFAPWRDAAARRRYEKVLTHLGREAPLVWARQIAQEIKGTRASPRKAGLK